MYQETALQDIWQYPWCLQESTSISLENQNSLNIINWQFLWAKLTLVETKLKGF